MMIALLLSCSNDDSFAATTTISLWVCHQEDGQQKCDASHFGFLGREDDLNV